MSGSTKSAQAVRDEFGVWIRQQRLDARLTQVDVAKASGLSEVQYARIEKGESGTKRDTVIALARAVGCSTNEALGRAGYATADEPYELGIENVLPHGYENLSPEQQALFRQQLRDIGKVLLRDQQ